jgi:hypothetical protein
MNDKNAEEIEKIKESIKQISVVLKTHQLIIELLENTIKDLQNK